MRKSTTFGDYIRQMRDKANLGLREAARELGISASYLSRIEANDYPAPSGEKLRRMAQFYDADIHEMMRLAQNRAHEVMAADTRMGPVVQHFYRLAQNQSPDTQERMLIGAIDALNLPEDQKRKLLENLKAALSRSNGRDLPRLARGDDGLFAYDVKPRYLSREDIELFAKHVLNMVFGPVAPLPVPIETLIRKAADDIVLIIDGEMEGACGPTGDPAILGLSRWSRDGERRELVIHEELFNATNSPTRRRMNFTMGHELFHCLEHLSLVVNRTSEDALKRTDAFVSLPPRLRSELWFERKRSRRKLFTNEDWREWQANTFSSAVLMPADCVRASFVTITDTDQLILDSESQVEETADQLARMSFVDDFGQETTLIEQFDVNPHAMAIRLISLGLITS